MHWRYLHHLDVSSLEATSAGLLRSDLHQPERQEAEDGGDSEPLRSIEEIRGDVCSVGFDVDTEIVVFI